MFIEWIGAIFFAGMGLIGLISPKTIGQMTGLGVEGADAENEIRAVYGGFGIAIAFALQQAMQNPEWHQGILIAVSLALAGMAAGRVVSIAFKRPDWPMYLYLVGEAALAFALARVAGVI